MRRFNLFFVAILVPLDYLMLALAGISAYLIRTSNFISRFRPVLFDIDLTLDKYLGIVALVAFFWLVVFALNGLYRIRRWRLLEEFFRIISGASAGLMAIIIYIFISGKLFNSRLIILFAWILAVIFVFIGRIFIRKIRDYLVVRHNFGISNLLIIGNDKVTKSFIEELERAPELGLRVIKKNPELSLAAIQEIVDSYKIDQILLGELNNSADKILALIDLCQEKGITLKFIPNLFQTATANLKIDTIGTIPVVELRKTALGGWGRIIKRIIDIILSSFFLVLFSLIMAIIALIIKSDSEGPIIYKNLRVGPRKKFKVYKFRSFYLKYCTGREYPHHKEASEFEDMLARAKNLKKGPVFKIHGDPRRTHIGRFLERWSLDELPQFWNVLKGEMSLVGPRPHMPKEVAGYQKHHKKVFNIKPGITGLAQVSGRSDLEFEEEAKLDIFYLENWSLGLDFKIMIKTPFVALFGKHKS